MLENASLGMAIIINIIIIFLWHFLSYLLAGTIGQKHVDYRKFPYKAHKFEKHGRFYTENFDIENWFMLLPIKINSEDISSNGLESADTPKLKKHLTVTCRGELCCIINCLYFFYSAIMNVPYLAFIIGVIVILGNLPFIAANRYVRFVLLKALVEKRKRREIIEYIEENNPDKYDLDSF